MMVGHNPGFEDLVGRLSGSHERMPTAALACLEFQVERWSDVGDEEGKLVWLLIPKELKAKRDD
jgi:phosphohistidine phosphatase